MINAEYDKFRELKLQSVQAKWDRNFNVSIININNFTSLFAYCVL